MTFALLSVGSVLAVLLTLCLVREVRLRRALQKLLKQLFEHWNPTHETNPKPAEPAAAGDTDWLHRLHKER